MAAKFDLHEIAEIERAFKNNNVSQYQVEIFDKEGNLRATESPAPACIHITCNQCGWDSALLTESQVPSSWQWLQDELALPHDIAWNNHSRRNKHTRDEVCTLSRHLIERSFTLGVNSLASMHPAQFTYVKGENTARKEPIYLFLTQRLPFCFTDVTPQFIERNEDNDGALLETAWFRTHSGRLITHKHVLKMKNKPHSISDAYFPIVYSQVVNAKLTELNTLGGENCRKCEQNQFPPALELSEFSSSMTGVNSAQMDGNTLPPICYFCMKEGHTEPSCALKHGIIAQMPKSFGGPICYFCGGNHVLHRCRQRRDMIEQAKMHQKVGYMLENAAVLEKTASRVRTKHKFITRQITCFYCMQTGHIQAQCPEKIPNKHTTPNNTAQNSSTSRERRESPNLLTHKFASLSTLALIICMLAIINTAPSVNALSYKPMLCPPIATPSLWKIPTHKRCAIPKIGSVNKPTPHKLSIFKLNIGHYESQANLCMKTHTKIKYKTDISNNRDITERATITVPITREECRKMITYHRCEFGALSKTDGVHKTNNTPPTDWTGNIEGLWIGEKESESYNCILAPTYVVYSYDEREIKSPSGKTQNCNVEDRECVLEDGSILLWAYQLDVKCRYKLIDVWNGYAQENIWIAEDKEFAISFSKYPKQVNSCGDKLVISEQNFAIPLEEYREMEQITHDRAKRSTTNENEGIVLSSQLAAQLTAVEVSITTSLSLLFKNMALSICSSTDAALKRIGTSLISNPTVGARHLLNVPYIQASLVTESLLEIRPCSPIEISSLKFIGTQNPAKCYKFLPIEISLPHKNFSGFLDPITKIISPTAPPHSCEYARELFLEIDTELFKINQITGQRVQVPNTSIFIANTNVELIKLPELPIMIFHNLPVTNVSELLPSRHYEASIMHYEMERQMSRILPEIANSLFSQLTHKIIGQGIFGSVLAYTPSLWQVWVFVCCGCVTIGVIHKTLLPLLLECFFYQYPHLRRLFHDGAHAEEVIELRDQARQRRNSWPPQVSIQVNAYGGTAQIAGHINQIPVLMLLDTGSQTTLGHASLLPVIGIHELDPIALDISGIGGQELPIIGSSIVDLDIANFRITTRMFFSQAKASAPSSKFDIIVGSDVMTILPPITFDFAASKVRIAKSWIKMGKDIEDAPVASPIHLLNSTLIPPNSEKVVAAYLQMWYRTKTSIFTISMKNRIV